jgi:hypothetical protein
MVIKVAELLKQNISDSIWCDVLFNQYTDNSLWIVSDLRFPYEYEAVKSRGGIVIKVSRPEARLKKMAMDGFLDDYIFDEYVTNSHGDNYGFIEQALSIVDKYNLRRTGDF